MMKNDLLSTYARKKFLDHLVIHYIHLYVQEDEYLQSIFHIYNQAEYQKTYATQGVVCEQKMKQYS